MKDIGYFYEWVAEGAAFGVKAFCAATTIALILLICWAVLTLIGQAAEACARGGRRRKKGGNVNAGNGPTRRRGY